VRGGVSGRTRSVSTEWGESGGGVQERGGEVVSWTGDGGSSMDWGIGCIGELFHESFRGSDYGPVDYDPVLARGDMPDKLRPDPVAPASSYDSDDSRRLPEEF